jgi:hypothetical protein
MLKDRLRQHELQLFPLFGSCLDLPEDADGDTQGEAFQALDLSINANTHQGPVLVTHHSINSEIARSVTMVTVKSEPLESQELSNCAKRKSYPATSRHTTRPSPFISDDGNGRVVPNVPNDHAASDHHSHTAMDNVVSQKAKRSFQKAVEYSLTHTRGGKTSVSSADESTSSRTSNSHVWPNAPVAKTLTITPSTPLRALATTLTASADPSSTASTSSTFVTATPQSEEHVSYSPIVRLSDYITLTLRNMSTRRPVSSMGSMDYFPLESILPSESKHSNIGYTGCHSAGQQTNTYSLYDHVRNGVLGVTQFYWCHVCNSFCWRPEVDGSAHAQCKMTHSSMGECARPSGCMTQHRKFVWPGYVMLNCSLCGNMYNSVNVFRYHMSVDHRMYMYSQS